MTVKNYGFLSGNALKIIACALMTVDHVGYILFPNVIILRIIGRLAFPIFAFMIAEGVKYTKNKLRYFLLIFVLGTVFQIVTYIYSGDTFMGIFITFSLAIPLCYAVQFVKRSFLTNNISAPIKALSVLTLVFGLGAVYLINHYITIDYGFYGCILPAVTGLFHLGGNTVGENTISSFEKIKKFDNFHLSVLMLAIGLIGVWLGGVPLSLKPIQPYSFLAIPLLLLYNGKRGKYNIKFFFYLFYPIHLLIIYCIGLII